MVGDEKIAELAWYVGGAGGATVDLSDGFVGPKRSGRTIKTGAIGLLPQRRC